jgi:multiple sugar transport system substrate-binding protein
MSLMKRSQRLRLIPVALVALSAAFPVATHMTEPTTVSAHSSASIDIRFANFIDPTQLPLVKSTVLPAFNKAYPGVSVSFEPIPDSRVKAVTQIAAGTAADVFNLGDGDVGWYEDRNALENLTPYAKAAGFSFSQYVPSTLILGHTANGGQYALPKDYSSLAVYYNKDMFKAAGLPMPSANWTWDEFRNDAIKLTKNGVEGFTAGGDWSRLVDAVVRSLGGRLISPDGRTVMGYMNSAASVKAVSFWVNLFTKDKVALTPTEAKAINGDEFASGKAAMNITGIWPSLGATGYRKTLKFNWGVAPFPRGTASANTICWAGFVMSKATKHPREAFGLIST